MRLKVRLLIIILLFMAPAFSGMPGSAKLSRRLLPFSASRRARSSSQLRQSNPTAFALARAMRGQNVPCNLEYDKKEVSRLMRRIKKSGATSVAFDALEKGQRGAFRLKILIDAQLVEPTVCKDDGGAMSLVHVAAALNAVNALEVLLSYRHVSADGHQGQIFTPLMVAARYGCNQSVLALLEHGARVDCLMPHTPFARERNIVGFNAIGIATRYLQITTQQLLQEHLTE